MIKENLAADQLNPSTNTE
jgi:hypothetical protein